MPSRAVSLIDLVVHELRSPLTVAIGSLRQAAAPGDPATEALIARALRSCERLDRLATEMRDWTRLGDGPTLEVEPVAVAALAGDAARHAVLSRHGEVDVTVDVDPGLAVEAAPRLAASALAALWTALARAADRGDAIAVTAETDGAGVVLLARRPGAAAPGEDTFAAEWLGGLGFSMPLARASIEASGGAVSSRSTADGRLVAVSVRLPAAGAPRPSR